MSRSKNDSKTENYETFVSLKTYMPPVETVLPLPPSPIQLAPDGSVAGDAQ